MMSWLGIGFLQCSAGMDSDDGSSFTGDGDGDGQQPPPSSNTDIRLGGLGGSDGHGQVTIHPLCGEGACLPDDEMDCSIVVGGAGGGPGELIGGAAGNISFDPGGLGTIGSACRVNPASDCEGESCGVVRSCEPTGAGLVGDPCVAAVDCSAGLTCVGEGPSGVCRAYCCEGTARSCDSGSFCDERPQPHAPEIYVPVCLPIDGCSLTEPFPCPEGQECTCKGDRACVVVRSDGATSCTEPGVGQLGDPCTGAETAECAHGFVCSSSAGCMKICSTTAEESECPEAGVCQSPSGFPVGLGVCVGSVTGPPVTP